MSSCYDLLQIYWFGIEFVVLRLLTFFPSLCVLNREIVNCRKSKTEVFKKINSFVTKDGLIYHRRTRNGNGYTGGMKDRFDRINSAKNRYLVVDNISMLRVKKCYSVALPKNF